MNINPIPQPTLKQVERFMNKVEKTDTSCWLWKGCLTVDGYGVVGYKSQGIKKNYSAHRVSYLIYRGDLDTSKTIDHLCRIRSCVNPDHLELVPHTTNVKRRPAIIDCPRGHRYVKNSYYLSIQGSKICLICDRLRNRRSYYIKNPVSQRHRKGLSMTN